MAAIEAVSLARDGESEIRAAAALTTSYVGGKKIPSRTAEEVEFVIYLTTKGSVGTLDAVVEYSTKQDPNDDTLEDGEVGAEWVRHKNEVVTAGVVAQLDVDWRWTVSAAGVFAFVCPARGNWMRLFLKADNGTNSVCSAACLVKK